MGDREKYQVEVIKMQILSLAELMEIESPEYITVTDDGFILDTGIPNYEYFIEKDRCKTHEDILAWVFHITEKKWVNRDMIREFIKKTVKAAGINYPFV